MAAELNELESLYAELEPMLAGIGVDTAPRSAATVDAMISKVEAAIAPLTLHPQLKWFWRTWPRLGGECSHPGFSSPIAGLSLREENLIPPSLYELGYADYVYLFVELGSGGEEANDGLDPVGQPAGPGPRIYVYGMFEDVGIRLIFTSFADLLRHMIMQLEMERGSNFLAQAEQLEALLPPSVGDDDKRSIDPADASNWPQRWQRMAGITPAEFQLRGATHTVAEFEAARASGSIEATLVGSVTHIAGSGQGGVVRLTDGTGSIEMLVPNSLISLGNSPSGRYEIDVTASRRVEGEVTTEQIKPDHAEIQRLALSGDIEAAARAALPLGHHVTGNHPVVATAKRPITAAD